MRLILVRHGETEANVNGVYSGWTNYHLTEKGKKQVKRLVNILVEENIDVIYSSPSERTLDTARNIGSLLNLEVNIKENIRELNFGIFEGKTNKEIQDEFQRDYKAWVEDFVNFRIPKGESLQDLYTRINSLLTDIKGTDKTYLFVTHGGVIQTIITMLLGLELKKMWNFKAPPGCLVEIEYKDGFGILTKLTSN